MCFALIQRVFAFCSDSRCSIPNRPLPGTSPGETFLRLETSLRGPFHHSKRPLGCVMSCQNVSQGTISPLKTSPGRRDELSKRPPGGPSDESPKPWRRPPSRSLTISHLETSRQHTHYHVCVCVCVCTPARSRSYVRVAYIFVCAHTRACALCAYVSACL